jgi:hypothetical protein
VHSALANDIMPRRIAATSGVADMLYSRGRELMDNLGNKSKLINDVRTRCIEFREIRPHCWGNRG